MRTTLIDVEGEGNALTVPVALTVALTDPVALTDALTVALTVPVALTDALTVPVALVVSVTTAVETAEVVTVFENEIDGVFDGVTEADPLADADGVGLRVAGADRVEAGDTVAVTDVVPEELGVTVGRALVVAEDVNELVDVVLGVAGTGINAIL
jgi:hypothetical protein